MHYNINTQFYCDTCTYYNKLKTEASAYYKHIALCGSCDFNYQVFTFAPEPISKEEYINILNHKILE